MKRILLAMLALAVVTGAVYAKDKKGKKLEHMKATLELTDDQAGKLERVFESHREATKPQRRRLRDLTAKLKDQLEDKAGEGDLKGTLDAIEKTRKDLQAQREKMRESMAAILTVTQQARMVVSMRERLHGKHGPRGKGGPGRHGPGDKDAKDAPADDGEEAGGPDDD